MKAKEYIRERTRMFDSLRAVGYKGKASCNGILCRNCPLNCSSGCINHCINHTEQSVDIVEQWSKEHPIKTIKQDFLEKYPNAERYSDGSIKVCAREAGYDVSCEVTCPVAGNCDDCWNTLLEEAE